MHTLVLLRHGQSAWNKANQFTGWMDADLTAVGEEEARRAGRDLRDAGFRFDCAYTSLLKRAIRTLWIALEALDQVWLPVEKHWRLNERHYGALQGLNKSEMVDRYGKEQVFAWRRSYNVRPPLLSPDDPHHPRLDPRYSGVDPALLPAGESLEDTLQRVLPYFQAAILPVLRESKQVLLVAHGNSLRALVCYLERVPPESVHELAVPHGIPMVYTLDDSLTVVKRTFIGDSETVRAASAAAQKASQVQGSDKTVS